LVAAAVEQLNRVTLTSRAFHHTLLARLPGACRVDRNRDGAPDEHGCRTVESALKVARLTFGGNPLACAVGRAVIALLASGISSPGLES
jgi:acetylornithine/succinyldiaminopimelate/putrescine aminotransferase